VVKCLFDDEYNHDENDGDYEEDFAQEIDHGSSVKMLAARIHWGGQKFRSRHPE